MKRRRSVGCANKQYCVLCPGNLFVFDMLLSPAFASTVHTIAEALAYTVGYQYYRYLRKAKGDSITGTQRLYLFVSTVVGALIGSRVVGMLEQPALSFQTSNLIQSILSNKSIVGGLLGGLVATELAKKREGIVVSTGDLITYPILLGLIIGRIGCFFAGLQDGTSGIQTTLPWGIDFGDGVFRHPTQLYEILFALVLWLMLVILERHATLSDGARFKLFLSLYLLFRFWVEFIKPDPAVFLSLSTIQWTCVAGMLYYWKVFLRPQHLIAAQPTLHLD